MAKILAQVLTTDTFDTWLSRTNEMATAFSNVVTLNDVAALNIGNINITGSISALDAEFSGENGIKTDFIFPHTPNAKISLNTSLEINGELDLVATLPTQPKVITYFVGNEAYWTVGPDANSNYRKFYISGSGGNPDSVASEMWIDDDNGELNGNIKINANMLPELIADKWDNAITITFAGDVSGSVSFDGSADATASLTVRNDFLNDYYTKTQSDNRFLNKSDAGGDTMTGNLTVGTGAGKVQLAQGSQAENGTIIATGDITAFGSFSDIHRKENINKIENALEKVMKLSGYTFNYIDAPEKPMTGVIAQEVEEVLPEVVYDTFAQDGTETKAVRYGNMMGLIIEAIKELQNEIAELKSQQ